MLTQAADRFTSQEQITNLKTFFDSNADLESHREELNKATTTALENFEWRTNNIPKILNSVALPSTASTNILSLTLIMALVMVVLLR